MKIGKLIGWFFKDEALTQTVKNFRFQNPEASLKLSKDELQIKATKIYDDCVRKNGKDGWFKDSHVGAIKSTLKQLMREERALKITNLAAFGRNYIGTPRTKDEIKAIAKVLYNDPRKSDGLKGLTEKDIFLTLSNLAKIQDVLVRDGALCKNNTSNDLCLTIESIRKTREIAKPMIRRFEELQTTFQKGFAGSTIKQYDAYLKTFKTDSSENMLQQFAPDQTKFAKQNPELPLMLVSDLVFTLKENFTETEMNQLMKSVIPPAHLVSRMTKLLEDESLTNKLKIFSNILWQIPRIKETLSPTELEFLNWMGTIGPMTTAQTNVTQANLQNGYDETTINRYATYLTIPRHFSLENRLKNFAEADRAEVATQYPKLDTMLVKDLALTLKLNFTKTELKELVTLLKSIIEKNNHCVNSRSLEQVLQSFYWGYNVMASLYGVEGMDQIPLKLGKIIKLLEDPSFKNKMNIFSSIPLENPGITDHLSPAETELLNLSKEMLSN